MVNRSSLVTGVRKRSSGGYRTPLSPLPSGYVLAGVGGADGHRTGHARGAGAEGDEDSGDLPGHGHDGVLPPLLIGGGR
jgi:hypothetical protein